MPYVHAIVFHLLTSFSWVFNLDWSWVPALVRIALSKPRSRTRHARVSVVTPSARIEVSAPALWMPFILRSLRRWVP